MAPTGDQPEISILDARLAEIDRRLHSIQSGLVEDESHARPSGPPRHSGPPGPPRPSGPPGPPRLAPSVAVPGDRPRSAPPPLPPRDAHSAAELLIRLREVTAEQEGLLDSMRRLLGTLQSVAAAPATAIAPGSAPAPAPATPAGAAGATPRQAVSIAAGPFASTEALRAFRTALEALPGVRRVELRGFEGVDRAVLEVHL